MPSNIDQLTERVEAELRSIVLERDMPLYRLMSYHLGWTDQHGEKTVPLRVRRPDGLLCLLACRAAGGDTDDALPAAASIELVRGFCEIHDDVQGGIPQRDRRDAVWWIWGPAQAINAGDGMHALARLALFRLRQRDVAPGSAFRALTLEDEASLQACEGRFLALEAQERLDLSVQSYMNMVSMEAGALPSCAMGLGGLVASCDEEVVSALATCGAKVGIARRLRAELRELWGDERADDAPSAEVMNKTKLLPIIYALEMAPPKEKRRLGDIYFKRVLEADDVDRLRDAVQQLGAREHCEQQVSQHRAEAVSSLAVPGISPEGKDDITAFVDSLLE